MTFVQRIGGVYRGFVVNQAQYVFCHDAVLEVMLCGDTSVEAPNLRTHVSILKKVDSATEKTGFEKQLQVCLLSLDSMLSL